MRKRMRWMSTTGMKAKLSHLHLCRKGAAQMGTCLRHAHRMKATLSFLMIAGLLAGKPAMAADFSVQMVGQEEPEFVSIEEGTLQDLKLKSEVTLDGYGIVCPTAFEFTEEFSIFRYGWEESGAEAEYAILYMDITNLMKTEYDFTFDVKVTVNFDGQYEYEGWVLQSDYDKKQGAAVKESFPVSPMYQGHYFFGCTLPNAVVNSEKSLVMTITMDGYEMTYYIRK